MLTPPESGESPTIASRDGGGFMSVNGGGHATNGNAAFPTASTQQTQASRPPQNLVEGIWSRLIPEANRSPNQPLTSMYPTDSKAAAQQQVTSANQAAVDRQISVEVAKLVASFRSDDAASEERPQPSSSVPYRGLDYEGLCALRQYIYAEDRGVSMDEEALLNQLERTWREGVRADYNKMVENLPVFIARERAFLTWVELKRHMAALLRANERAYNLLICIRIYTLTSIRRLVGRRRVPRGN